MKSRQTKNISSQIMTNPKIFFINKETGEKVELSGVTTSSLSSEEDGYKVNIHNSYNFECDLKIDSLDDETRELLFGNAAWKTACRLADQLNDLIEDYHALGTPRRERRAIKREFDKIFRIYQKHCQTNNINFKFVRQ